MRRRHISFLLVGGLGLSVDVALLMVMTHLAHIDVFSARIFGIAGALCCTWIFNRTFTFERSGRSLAVEGVRYGGIGITANVANYCLYSAILLLVPDAPPLAALLAGSAFATLLSYNGYSRFVFND